MLENANANQRGPKTLQMREVSMCGHMDSCVPPRARKQFIIFFDAKPLQMEEAPWPPNRHKLATIDCVAILANPQTELLGQLG